MIFSASDHRKKIHDICAKAPVIPVLTINDIKTALPLAEALIAGGLPVLEITLRTDIALEAIHIMQDIKGGYIGAGTLLTAKDAQAAKDAGACFGVSPGVTDNLLNACQKADLPLLPGVATLSEIMLLSDLGYDILKFFPAEAIGGVKALSSINAPLPHIKFCPTGGININNARDYLNLPNVLTVGGSWVAPEELIKNGKWDEITALAQQASQLGSNRFKA